MVHGQRERARVATYTTTPTVSGPVTVNATYLGDANNAPSSGTMTETITQIPTVTTLTSSANPAAYGAAITFTATVLDSSGNPAKGFVDFAMGTLGYAQVDLDSAGQAAWASGNGGADLLVGADTITASFASFGEGGAYAQSSGSVVETITATGVTPAPTFSPVAGTYTSDQLVTLSDTATGATIYYTTDGSSPVVDSSTEYPSGGSIPVNASQTIMAIAIAPGDTASTVASVAYVINIPAPDFSVTLSSASMTVAGGGSGTTQVTIAPLNGFSQAVSFSCSGLPGGASCSFSPTTVTPVVTSSATTLTIAAPSSSSSNRRPVRFPFAPVTSLALALVCVGSRRRRLLSMPLLIVMSAVVLFSLSACGGGSGGGSQTPPPPPIYTVTVAATSGSITHSAALSLAVN